MKSILIVTSVASMVDQFLMPYIEEYTNKNIKVVVATNFVIPGTITSERSREVIQQLKSLNVEVEQVDFARNPLSKANFKAYKQLIRVIKNEEFDIIHSHSPIGGLLTRLAARNQKNAEVIYTAHGFHFYEGAPISNWFIYYPIEKYMARYTDALITMNEQDYQLAKSKFKTRQADGIYKINGVGVDISGYVVTEIDYEFKAKLGIPKDNFVITIIGELNRNKNQIQMIQALEQLNDSTITLVLVGTGINYQLFNEKFRDNSNVKVLGYRTDVREILNITDIVGSMSYREGLPKNVMEAMAASKPVIATNIRGNQDLVVDGETGYLVEVGDIQGTVEAILKLKTQNHKFGENGRKQIEKYSINNVISNVMNIYTNDIEGELRC